MSNIENAPDLNNSELDLSEAQKGLSFSNKFEGDIVPEESDKPKETEVQKSKEQELSPENQLKNLEVEIETQQREITMVSKSIESTKNKLSEIRKNLGLSVDEEEPPQSVFLEKNNLERLETEQEALEKQKEELVSQQEKEQLINEEKNKILQEKLDELFKEFEVLSNSEFESIFNSGKTQRGSSVESESMGLLDPKVAQSLAKAFKEGVKMLPKILEVIPGLLKKFDEDLKKEATERINKRLEEEKQKIENEQEEDQKKLKFEEETKTSEDKALSIEMNPEIDLNEGGGVEIPKL